MPFLEDGFGSCDECIYDCTPRHDAMMIYTEEAYRYWAFGYLGGFFSAADRGRTGNKEGNIA